MGHVTAATLARFLGDQLEIPCVTWIGRIPDEVAGVVPKILAQRLRVLPLRLDENGALHLAMEDPLDIKAIDAVTKYTGRVVHPVVVPETVLLQALAKNYRLLSPSRLRATRDDEQE